ncbi:MAG: hypothetical protein UW70_C0023G0001 [Candidatus Peregrinibacteria bacterium GW2011_GWA2_44_7]|nr:MAG: hypothetical protein UW70_C0023G0001 [Candidatus Peregrinibacteria bacterium GW2011_GWA2_44_7]
MNHSSAVRPTLGNERAYRRLKEREEKTASAPRFDSEYVALNHSIHHLMKALPFPPLENRGVQSLQIGIKASSTSAQVLQSALLHCAAIIENPHLTHFLNDFFQTKDDFYIELAVSTPSNRQEARLELFHGDRRPLLSSQFSCPDQAHEATAFFSFGERSPADQSLSAPEQLFFTQSWVAILEAEFLGPS